MFFLFSKILSFFVHPFSWVLLLGSYGLITQNLKRKKWAFRAGGIALLFFTNTVIFCEFARLWEVDGTKIEDVTHHDVAIVLGGMAEYDNSLERLSIRRGGDRLWQAMHLYYLGKVDKIMLVGANGDVFEKGLEEAKQFKEVLLDFGIPEADIIVEEKSKNTHQNAVESKKVLENYPEIKEVLLVTSALHMRRSIACFKAAGFEDIDPFTTDHYTGEIRGYHFEQFILPNISVMRDWSMLMHEWVGYISYWIAGYV